MVNRIMKMKKKGTRLNRQPPSQLTKESEQSCQAIEARGLAPITEATRLIQDKHRWRTFDSGSHLQIAKNPEQLRLQSKHQYLYNVFYKFHQNTLTSYSAANKIFVMNKNDFNLTQNGHPFELPFTYG